MHLEQALVEPRPVEAAIRQAIVADEQRIGLDLARAVISLDGEFENAGLHKGAQRGARRGDIAAEWQVGVLADLRPRPRHFREIAEPGQRMEDASIDSAEIDPLRLGLGEHVERDIEVGRDAEAARKEVHGSERQHAERALAALELLGRIADGAIAAADDDRRRLGSRRLVDGRDEAVAFGKLDRDALGMAGKRLAYLRLDLARLQVADRARARVQDDDRIRQFRPQPAKPGSCI